MVLEFPARVRDLGEAERIRQLYLPVGVRRRLPVYYCWATRNRRVLVFAALGFAVLGFSGAWTDGALVLDGPGIAMYLRLALDHLGADRTVPYWLPDLWAGTPVWAVASSLPVFILLPLATAVGPDVAVKAGVLALQVTGSCGAYVLARSLWRNLPAAVVAGILFGLQPILVSHAALAGALPTVAVMAAVPWLVWALRKGLHGDGRRYVVGAGLVAGFSLLMQAEYAIGLVVVGACLLLAEAGRVRSGDSQTSMGQLLARAAAVAGIALGLAAYWLLPFLDLSEWFILSPHHLDGDIQLGRDLGAFFGRAGALSGSVSFHRPGLLPRFLHVGWVGLALTLVTVVFLSRRVHDGTLPAVLLSGAAGIWLSTGAVPLASSDAAVRDQVAPFLVAGLVAGLLLGSLLRPLRLGRLTPVLIGAGAVFLAAVPSLTPFVALQDLFAIFERARLPRVYTVVPLALALGAAYTVVLVQDWAERHRARSASAALPSVLAGSVALVVVGVSLVDVWPSRSFYRVRPPAREGTYRELVATLANAPRAFRIASDELEPSAVNALLDTGRQVSIGWPRTVASTHVWRLSAEPFLTPSPYRLRALGLSGTSHQVRERPEGKGTATETVSALDLADNPRALPLARAYTHTVAMAGRELTPELAVGLAYRNVGVFTGSPSVSPALAATTVVDVRSITPCADDSGARLDPALASQLGVACGLHTWLETLLAGVDLFNIDQGAGAVFRSTTDRLQGVAAYLDRGPDRAELALHEVMPGGRTLGQELTRARAVGFDEFGLTAFTFDPIRGSAGKEYAFVLTCPGCAPDKVPKLVAGRAVDRPGNLIVAGGLRRDRAAAFAPVYEPVASDPPTSTTLEASRPGPGRWRVQASGPAPALVVVAEAWFPGWTAEVDGRRAPVVEADGGFLGVPVDAGDHVITLAYERPAAATAGRTITAATFLLLAVLTVRRLRAKPRPPAPVVVAAPPPVLPAPLPPLLPARVRPRVEPEPPPEPDEPNEGAWDEVVRPPHHRPPQRRPGTAKWPPEPL